MKVLRCLALFTNLMVSVHGGSHLVKRDEGYYITGRGCGLSTPMKYLKEVPQNLDDHQCSFIPNKDKIAFLLRVESFNKMVKESTIRRGDNWWESADDKTFRFSFIFSLVYSSEELPPTEHNGDNMRPAEIPIC